MHACNLVLCSFKASPFVGKSADGDSKKIITGAAFAEIVSCHVREVDVSYRVSPRNIDTRRKQCISPQHMEYVTQSVIDLSG